MVLGERFLFGSAITISLILGTGLGELKASNAKATVEACPMKKAVVILGLLPPRFNGGFKKTAYEMSRDFTERGYGVQFLVQPKWTEVREFFANNPCLKGFGFVGEGVEADSPNADVGDNDGTDVLFLNEAEEGIVGKEALEWTKNLKLDLVVIHACHQGSPNNALKWKRAFHLAIGGFFKGWDYNVKALETYWWQYFWK